MKNSERRIEVIVKMQKKRKTSGGLVGDHGGCVRRIEVGSEQGGGLGGCVRRIVVIVKMQKVGVGAKSGSGWRSGLMCTKN